jgi:hypothetical protein
VFRPQVKTWKFFCHVNIKRDCSGESPFRWLGITQSPYYTFILWKRNFILLKHTINTFIFHVKIFFFSYVCFTYSVHESYMKTYRHFLLTCERKAAWLTTEQSPCKLMRNTRTLILRQIKQLRHITCCTNTVMHIHMPRTVSSAIGPYLHSETTRYMIA